MYAAWNLVLDVTSLGPQLLSPVMMLVCCSVELKLSADVKSVSVT